MTVQYHRGQWADIHEYSKDVGAGIAAVDTAAFAWLAAEHPGKAWSLRPNTVYRNSAPVDLRVAAGQGLSGVSSETTAIMPTYDNAPVVITGGNRGAWVEGVRLGFEFIPPAANTAAVAIELAAEVTQQRFSDVYMKNVNRGFNLFDGALFFSNIIEGLRVEGWSDVAIELTTGGNSSGTGNDWSDIYLSNINEANPGTFPNFNRIGCRGYIYMESSEQETFSQLDLRWAACSDRPTFFSNSGPITINGLVLEGVEWPDDMGILSFFGAFAQGVISGGAFSFLQPNPAINSQALFEITEGVYLSVDGVRWRDSATPGVIHGCRYNSVQPSAGAEVHMRNIRNLTGDLAAINAPGAAAVPGNAFREYNDIFHSLVDAGQVYRITAPGGVLTSTLQP